MKTLFKGIFSCLLMGTLIYSSSSMMANSDKVITPAPKPALVFNDCTGIPSWVASQTYYGWESVKHKGNEYLARWWSWAEEPGTNPNGAWQYLGPCTDPY